MEEKLSPKDTKIREFIKAKLKTESRQGRLGDLVISIVITVIAYFPIKAIVSLLSKNTVVFMVILLFWAWIYFMLRFRK